jgi:hypothetical protein
MCQGLVGQRTGIINQARALLLECGIAVRRGLRCRRAQLPGILAKRYRACRTPSGSWSHRKSSGLKLPAEAAEQAARRNVQAETKQRPHGTNKETAQIKADACEPRW